MERLEAHVLEVKQCMSLRGVNAENVGERTALTALHESLSAVETLIQEFEAYVAAENQGVTAGRQLLEQLRLREALIAHMESNFPEKINEAQQACKENAPPRCINAAPKGPGAAKGSRDDFQQKKVAVPVIPYVRVTEMDDVPAYMKGRLTRDQVNRMIDQLNITVAAKYKILSTPRGKLGDNAMSMYIQFKELELDDLAGRFFFVDADVKQLASGKIDRNVMTILRHLHRLSEHRSKGCVRHVIAPC